jgi:hypothetical protein
VLTEICDVCRVAHKHNNKRLDQLPIDAAPLLAACFNSDRQCRACYLPLVIAAASDAGQVGQVRVAGLLSGGAQLLDVALRPRQTEFIVSRLSIARRVLFSPTRLTTESPT